MDNIEFRKTVVAPIASSYEFTGAVIGALMGDSWMDSSANHPRVVKYDHDPKRHMSFLRFWHAAKSRDYVEWKVALLRNYLDFPKISLRDTLCGTNGKRYPSVVAQSRGNRKLSYLYPKMYKNRKKYISMKILNRLTVLGLSIWFMDDGSLQRRRAADGRYWPTVNARFHTEGFTKPEVEMIQTFLKKKWSIECSVVRNRQYHTLWLNGDNSKKLFDLVRPFVLQVPSMHYKLPEFDTSTGRLPSADDDIVRAA
jgi:hypothetical protein